MPGKNPLLLEVLAAITVCLVCAPAAVEGQKAANAPAGAPEHVVVLQVYKKWIGASGDEADVEIRLFCPHQKGFQPKFINRDQPGGWEISDVPPGGLFCNAREIGQDTFVADYGDCMNLLVIPGEEAECTIVNTKVVKRIDMLNRYGLAMMIAVMLGAGLAAVRRFGAL